MLNAMKLFIFLSICSLAYHIVPAQAEGKKCFKEIVIKNSSGPQHFGEITKKIGNDGEPFTIVPRSLGVDSNGNIYVGDSVNYRILKFDSKGLYLFEFKLQQSVKVIKPEISHIIQDIGIDKEDNVYVWNYLESRVEIYDQNGKYKESVSPADDKQKGVFTKTSKGRFSKYIYDIKSYTPDKKLPGKIFYSITVVDVGSKEQREISRCSGVKLASDEDGEIYSFDSNGNIYTFDQYFNVIRINPFK